MKENSFFNACLISDDEEVVKNALKSYSDFRLITRNPLLWEKYDGYQFIGGDDLPVWHKLYISSMCLPFLQLDSAAEKYYAGASLMVRCHYDLNEIGAIDGKFKTSPIGVMERLGILKGTLIAGGTYLDKDDAYLLKDNGCKLIVGPSYEAGCGYGLINVRPYLDWGLEIEAATYNNAYNSAGYIGCELALLKLLAAATDRNAQALSFADLYKIGHADNNERPSHGQIEKFEKSVFYFEKV